MSKEDKKGTNRAALLKACAAVRPALASQPYIPALTHLAFDGEFVTAFNDVSALQVLCDVELDCLVPGDALIRALGTYSGDTVLLQQDGEHVVITSGRSARVRLPALPRSDFPLRWPTGKVPRIAVTDSMLTGIRLCLRGVSNDDKRPAAMGVTLDVLPKKGAVLYSTDSLTISRYEAGDDIELPGDAPVILPTFFCEQLVKLADANKDEKIVVFLHPGALVATVGDERASLMSRIPVDLEPMDFERVMTRMCDVGKLKEHLEELPPEFDAALSRALLVLSQEATKSTKVTVGDGVLHLRSEGAGGVSEDRLVMGSSTDENFLVDPSLLARAAPHCKHAAFFERVAVMSSHEGRFVHMIAHVVPV